MDARFRALLACPTCGGRLDAGWSCGLCGASYDAPDDVPVLRLPGSPVTERVRAFYADSPFPGYSRNDSLGHLRARAGRSRFAQLLDNAIPSDATILDMGCGTGQMSLYLAQGDRTVIGADMTRASLSLGADAARRYRVQSVRFVETDLMQPGLRRGVFDVVYCAGVLHHTPRPAVSFARLATLAKPGGMIVIGLYHAFARLPLRLRRAVARSTGERWIPFDPVLSDRAAEPARREAWLRDQYRHPEEHRHTLGEVRRWFADNEIDYVRAFPSALLGGTNAGLFESEGDGWWLEEWLAQLAWAGELAGEGGLFVVVGRKAQPDDARPAVAETPKVRSRTR